MKDEKVFEYIEIEIETEILDLQAVNILINF